MDDPLQGTSGTATFIDDVIIITGKTQVEHFQNLEQVLARQADAVADAQAMLQSDRLFVHYDITKPLILECDSSPYGVVVVECRN